MSSCSRVRLLSLATIVLAATLLFGVLASPAFAKTAKHKRHKKEAYSVQAIRKVSARYRLPGSDVKALIELAYRESSWNPRCVTGSYRGLFQVDTHSKKWSDPFWNTARAIRDIKKAYKTPRRALSHSYQYGWY